MSFSDFLRKIGIMKTGGQTWKGDAKDRPLEDPDQQQEMADLDRKIDEPTDTGNDPSSSDNPSDW
ncbi:MAG: hypothetical protein Q8L09_02110 [Candidatus Moranbacteria bacterium]|nr:hypothetical protein [Candidatus Moranbacteria bacterium]